MTYNGPIIDFRVRVPAPELGHALSRSGKMARYESLYKMDDEGRNELASLPVAGFLAALQTHGLERIVWPAQDNRSSGGGYIPDELVSGYASQHPDFVSGLFGFDPHSGISEGALEGKLAMSGMIGGNIAPFAHEIYASDEKYWSLYEACEASGAPVVVHTSVNFAAGVTQDYGHPSHLDTVAIRFPELKIVAGHGGWPWVQEMISIVWRHENVFMDISGIRPKYLAKPGTGWEALLAYGESVVRDKVLYATNWPSLQHEDSIREMRELPIRTEALEAWMYRNAASLLDSRPGTDAASPSAH